MARTQKMAPHAQQPEPAAALEQMYAHPGFLLRRAHQIGAAVFDQECGGKLTPPQFSTLTLIDLQPGIDQGTVGRAMGLDRTTVAVVITNLVRQGWVMRLQDPRDGRRYCLELTPEGRVVARQVRGDAERAEQRLLSVFPAAESQQFIDLLRQFVGSFNEDSRAPVDDTALPLAQLRSHRPSRS